MSFYRRQLFVIWAVVFLKIETRLPVVPKIARGGYLIGHSKINLTTNQVNELYKD